MARRQIGFGEVGGQGSLRRDFRKLDEAWTSGCLILGAFVYKVCRRLAEVRLHWRIQPPVLGGGATWRGIPT